MRAHALALAIIIAMHTVGPSAQKAAPDVRTVSGEWTFSAEGYVMPLSLRKQPDITNPRRWAMAALTAAAAGVAVRGIAAWARRGS